MNIYQISAIYVIMVTAKCEQEDSEKSKISLLSFRKQVEESDHIINSNQKDDTHNSNIVEFLVKNVKEIFKDLSGTTIESTTLFLRPTITLSSKDSISLKSIDTNDVMLYDNLSLNTLLDKKHDAVYDIQIEGNNETNTTYKLLYLSKNSVNYQKSQAREHISSKSDVTNTSESDNGSGEQRQSCISCDNVNTEDCTDPRNKL